MKKAISLLFSCLVVLSAWSTRVVTFETDPNVFYPAVIPLVFQQDGVTLSVYGSAYGFMHGFSFYSTSYVSTSQGVITSIVIENPRGTLVFSSGTYSYYAAESLGRWSGSAQQVDFRPADSGVTTGRIIVTVEGDDDDDPTGETTLIVIYQKDYNIYCKTLDDEFVLMYGNLGGTFVNGDTIRGYAEVSYYRDIVQLSPQGQWRLIGHGPAVKPTQMVIEGLTHDMLHWYVCFKNVAMSASWVIADETGDLKLYNKFNIQIGPDGDVGIVDEVNIATINGLIDRILSGNVRAVEWYETYDVEGFLTIYNDEMELFPTRIDRQSVSLGDDVNGDGEVTLSDVNALIDYILERY